MEYLYMIFLPGSYIPNLAKPDCNIVFIMGKFSPVSTFCSFCMLFSAGSGSIGEQMIHY